jgi:2-polyprenyl-6-methoxyphenol hydroxylase-like FAD-dependent oxidoreductase
MSSTTAVFVAGGSLNGLTSALLLARFGVPCIVVERHPRTAIQYKFRGISPRSMEIYRSLGIEDEIRARDLIDDRSAAVARMKNLADDDVAWQGVPWSDVSDLSPTTAATCDQDQLEPILRTHAERLGADVRFDTELVDFTQAPNGVVARVRNRATGAEDSVRAAYLVAADGANSPIRQRLGITRHGPGVLQHWMNVIFETDLPSTLQGRAVRSVFLTDINGTFVPRGDGRWLMAVQYDPARGERPEDFTADRCGDLIRRGAGRVNVKVNVVDARPWEAAAAVADRYQSERVFLVGDSAHVMPPTGGFGGNTGIQDAYNLAWKLAAVVGGAAGPALLDTYDEERRPVADRTVAQALARLQAWFKDAGHRLPPAEPIADDNAVIFGYRYPAGAFVADETHTSDDLLENPRTPSSRPGARAPHVVVERQGGRVSTIDLFSGHWVLFAGAAGSAWQDAATQARTAALGVRFHRVGDADLRDVDQAWTRAYSVGPEGAVLIRPDGFVAWRGRDATPQSRAAFAFAVERLRFL